MWKVESLHFLQEKDKMLTIKDVFCGFFFGGGDPGMSEAGLNMLLGSTVKQPASYV